MSVIEIASRVEDARVLRPVRGSMRAVPGGGVSTQVRRTLHAVPTADSPEFTPSSVPLQIVPVRRPRTHVQQRAGQAQIDLMAVAVKVLAIVAGVGLLIVCGLVLGSLFIQDPGQIVTVQPGDTLWSIASTVPHSPDVPAAVADIKSLNNLGSDALTVGQSIELPTY